MRKIFAILVLSIFLSLPFLVSGALPSDPGYSWWTDLESVLEGILSKFWTIFVVFSVMAFIYAGFLFLTSSGDPDRIKRAKGAFIWGVVGVAAAILGYAMINIIKGIVGA